MSSTNEHLIYEYCAFIIGVRFFIQKMSKKTSKIDAQPGAVGIIETKKRLQKQAWRWLLLTRSKF